MDWIKVCKNTPDKPEIRHVARATGCTPGDAFAAWFRLWAWLDSATADGHLPLATSDDIDEVARLPGACKALAEAGWLEIHQPHGVTVMRWDTHNGASAKARALATARKNRERSRTGAESGYRPWHRKR